MNVIVDTSVWSLTLRRKNSDDFYKPLLENLMMEGRVILLGAVRQEILSGIKKSEHFDALRLVLQAFEDFPVTQHDYECAARYFNLCRAEGIQGANTDFLICAIAGNYNYPILTTDKDFEHFARILPITLHPASKFPQ